VIDKAAVKFGMPMGPIELIDTVGLDVAAGVGAELAPFLGLQVPAALSQVEPGKRGKKDGQGLYTWENGKAQEARASGRLQGTRGPGRPPDPAAAQRSGGLPARWRGRRCRPAGCRRDLRHRLRPLPRRPDPVHPRTGADALLGRLKALQAKYGDRFAPRQGWDNPALREPPQ
jgi:3-hydroxyacyl-CoA dehydrogenase/enoyl-CoA hydratase/3-hydroxybutyryl-CoA epimerase